jgi:two-component system sensor histidine kinase MprB
MSAVAIVACVVISVVTYQVARVSLYEELDGELVAIAEELAPQIAADVEAAASGSDALQLGNVVLELVQANKAVTSIHGEQQLVLESEEYALARLQYGVVMRSGVIADGSPYRIIAIPLEEAEEGAEATEATGYALVIGRELEPTIEALSSLSSRQWLLSAGAILLAVIAIHIISRVVMSPVRRLTRTVSSAARSADFGPLSVRGTAEPARLATAFNRMIDSLAVSRDRQTRLIADASHELRTPLTSLRTNVELLIADERSHILPDGARADILRDVAAQLGEFTSLVGDLVALSRDETPAVTMAPLNLRPVVEHAISRAKRRGPTLVFDITLDDIYVNGDSATLERAITNLLDNAVKFSPVGGTVTVRLDHRGLRIDDEGPGISEKDLPHIFDRFYRSEASRNTPGTGLGLSIVEHTITSHGGTISAGRSPSGGAAFIVRIPALDPAHVGDVDEV